MDKSYVSMEQNICMCCNKQFDTNALLLDQRLRNRFDRHTVTGYGVCDSCKKEGYVLMIVVDPSQSKNTGAHCKPYEMHRTGEHIYIKDKAFLGLFNEKLPKDKVCYVEPEVVEILKEKMKGVK